MYANYIKIPPEGECGGNQSYREYKSRFTMGMKKKIILSSGIIILLIMASITAAVLYYYHHPAVIKSLVEGTVSRSTGTSLKIKELSYSINPLKIILKGIAWKPMEQGHGFHLGIPYIIADMAFEGKFGQKSLILRTLKADSFSLNISKEMAFPEMAPGRKKADSFFDRALKQLIGLLLFRDFKIRKVEAANGHFTARSGDQIIRINKIYFDLNHDGLVSITCGIQMQLPLLDINFTAPHVRITTDNAISFATSELKCSLMIKNAMLRSHGEDVNNMDLAAKLVYDHNNKKIAFQPLDINLKETRLKKLSPNSSPLDIQFRTKGIFNLEKGHLNADVFYLRAANLFQLNCTLDAAAQPKKNIRIRALNCRLIPGKIVSFLPVDIKERLRPFILSGPVGIMGEVKAVEEQKKWRIHADLETLFNNNSAIYKAEEMEAEGRISGKIRMKGEIPDMMISGRLNGDRIVFSGKGVKFEPFKMGLALAGQYPVFNIKDLTAAMPQVKVKAGEKNIRVHDIGIHILDGKMDVNKKSIRLNEIRLDSSLFKNLQLNIDLNEERMTAQLKGKNFHLIESASAMNLLPSGWQVKCLDSINLKAVLKEKRYLSVDSEFGFKTLSFQDRHEMWAGDNISINARLNGKMDLKGDRFTADTTIEVHSGEVLYDRFYLDLKKNNVSLSGKFAYEIPDKFLKLSSLDIRLKDILTLGAHGSIGDVSGDQQIRLSFEIPEISVKQIFHHFISEPFHTEKPILTDMEIDGNIAANLKIEIDKKHITAKGRYTWQKGRLSSGADDFFLTGINLDLPVWYRNYTEGFKKRKDEKAGTEEILAGALSIRSVALPLFPEQPLSISLIARPNRLSIKNPTILKVPGGEIKIGPVECREIYRLRPVIETSIIMDSIELEPILSGIWPHPIQGTVDGELNPIRWEDNNIESHGEIKINIFNGLITLTDLAATGITTSAPVIKCNSRWDKLNLAQITTDTSFGKIEGILKGRLNDLEIAYSQPQRFDLLLETVKTKEVAQKISIKAVDNIARIGGGQTPFMGLAGLFTSFFREFPYKKIGIHASLENDVFHINGTVKEDGMEYLIKRGSFSGVNVVNQNPDNRISFKDMFKRIKRISVSKGGPVIK